jgi:ring-1,2-phenylacetyl-CoA epoxidase subunit PaaC
MTPLAELLLTMADDELVIGYWDSEWTGIAPMLEEDVAMSSISQDEIGHAKALYELLAELTEDDADRIAYGRAPEAYRHAALLNHARGDWAFTVARRFLYETADALRLESLAGSSSTRLASLAAKMRREETYHLLHFDLWLRRLAEGGADSRRRLGAALATLWNDAQSILAPLGGEAALLADGTLTASMASLRARWQERVAARLSELGLPALPEPTPPTAEDRGRRTADFAWLHGEMTMVAASEVGATW